MITLMSKSFSFHLELGFPVHGMLLSGLMQDVLPSGGSVRLADFLSVSHVNLPVINTCG